MRGRARAVLAVGITTVAMLAAACGGGGGDRPQGPRRAEVAGGEIIDRAAARRRTRSSRATPARCAAATSSTPSPRSWCTTTPTRRRRRTTSPSRSRPSDNKIFTVKLKPYKFQDGTDVKAKNFVDAWNYTAYGPNGQAGSYFFAPIAGYADVQCPDDASASRSRRPRRCPGLKVVDDTTFTIKTTEPVSNLPVRLGYSAFAPLPDSFFADPKAYEEKPIGAGPFKFDSSKSTPRSCCSKFADYSGANKPNVDKVTFRIYQDDGAAYADVVANNLDYTDSTSRPTSWSATRTRRDLPDRNRIAGDRARSPGSPSRRTTRSSRTTSSCARPSRWPSTGT